VQSASGSNAGRPDSAKSVGKAEEPRKENAETCVFRGERYRIFFPHFGLSGWEAVGLRTISRVESYRAQPVVPDDRQVFADGSVAKTDLLDPLAM